MSASASHRHVLAKSFILVFSDSPWNLEKEDVGKALGTQPAWRMLASEDRRMVLIFAERTASPWSSTAAANAGLLRMIHGDPSEFEEERGEPALANGALLEFDFEKKSVKALASIVGLPPLFLYEGEGHRILSSDLHSIAMLSPSGLQFDLEGVLDLCMYGFPVENRTLFRNARLVSGGASLKVSAEGVEWKRAWSFHDPEPLPDWKTYTQLQMEMFLSALRRMELRDSFLSLTAGLDTRTIFSALLSEDRPIPAYTLSGESPSLDARTARALCQAYRVPHEIVALDREFLRNLAEYTVEASKLSGGLASLGQSHQIHLYRKLPRSYATRVSGNMGNQLGRGGVEHVSMRAGDPAVLNSDLRKRIPERPRFAWTDPRTGEPVPTSHEFLFQKEFPFTQLGNYSIGHHFAIQQSPYASRDMIGTCYRQPYRSEGANSVSPLRLRLSDLRHRFLGESEVYSFQRLLIHRVGGFAAAYPINWGWRAKGGVSLAGLFRGALTIADAYTERAGWDSGLRGKALRALHITGLHEHRKPKQWLRDSLREFVRDTLLSTEIRNAGVLDVANVSRMLDEHYSDRAPHHRALVLALDLALATKNFRAKLA